MGKREIFITFRVGAPLRSHSLSHEAFLNSSDPNGAIKSVLPELLCLLGDAKVTTKVTCDVCMLATQSIQPQQMCVSVSF